MKSWWKDVRKRRAGLWQRRSPQLLFSACFQEAWGKKEVPAAKARKKMSLLMALNVWAGGEHWCCAVSRWCPQWHSLAAAPSGPLVHTCLPLTVTYSLGPFFHCNQETGTAPGALTGVTVPASLRTCWLGDWKCTYFYRSVLLQPSDWCQLFPWAALALQCLLSSLALLQVQGTWNSKLSIGMERNNSACDALYSTYKQGGSSGSHPSLIPSETKSPYSAGCLPNIL